MKGPCLCGDPYCPSCGNPSLAEIELAEEWMCETIAKENLDAEEYKIAVTVGLAAVKAIRDLGLVVPKDQHDPF